jgi:hypothetical protein
MPRSFNPNSEAGRRLEVVGQASCLSSAGVAVAGDFFPESFTSADRLACGSGSLRLGEKPVPLPGPFQLRSPG